MTIRIQRARSPYGLRLVLELPAAVLQPAEGQCLTVSDLRLQIDRKTVTRRVRRAGRVRRVRTGLLETTACPRAKAWPFRDETRFGDGTTATADTTAACS